VNLKDAGGRVPIKTDDPNMPYRLVDFPDRAAFDKLLAKVAPANRDKYWAILKKRAEGATLTDAGGLYGLSRERVRQMETKFMRLVRLSLDQ
jgi:DNA-directed RNA polymerase sigma subunit (sigma70/sigma32)